MTTYSRLWPGKRCRGISGGEWDDEQSTKFLARPFYVAVDAIPTGMADLKALLDEGQDRSGLLLAVGLALFGDLRQHPRDRPGDRGRTRDRGGKPSTNLAIGQGAQPDHREVFRGKSKFTASTIIRAKETVRT